MSTKYNIGIVIGRFQPLHVCHLSEVIIPALNESDTLVILLGSSQRPRTPKDPWTDEERANMIFAGLEDSGLNVNRLTPYFFRVGAADKNIHIIPLRDCLYSNSQWQLNVQEKIRNVIDHEKSGRAHPNNGKTIAVNLFGVNRDETTFYLDMFPQWNSKVLVADGTKDVVNGTMCRHALFGAEDPAKLQLTPSVNKFIEEWKKTERYKTIKAEYDFLENYKKEMSTFRHPIIFQTADNIILWKGHILLAKRRSFPGDGLWALPGGFIDADKTIMKSAIKIAKEKTKLTLKDEWLSSSKCFDHPKRSLRGRTITTAHLWKLPDNIAFDVEAGLRTSKVQWFEFSEVMRMGEELYEDHLDIIVDMLSIAR